MRPVRECGAAVADALIERDLAPGPATKTLAPPKNNVASARTLVEDSLHSGSKRNDVLPAILCARSRQARSCHRQSRTNAERRFRCARCSGQHQYSNDGGISAGAIKRIPNLFQLVVAQYPVARALCLLVGANNRIGLSSSPSCMAQPKNFDSVARIRFAVGPPFSLATADTLAAIVRRSILASCKGCSGLAFF